MAVDVSKHLERARRALERGKVPEAIGAYGEVLQAIPNHMESIQALADLHARNCEPDRAALYYAMMFDHLCESGEEARATALYTRALRGTSQPAERVAHYALLLQKQNRTEDAIDQYNRAATLFKNKQSDDGALACLERIAQLEPDNLGRHLALGETAEAAGKKEIAARAYLRAGQLAGSAKDLDRALTLFGRAHDLVPGDCGTALLLAVGLLRKSEAAAAARAADLLEPFAPTESNPLFLETHGDALLRTGQLDRARAVLERLYTGKRDGFGKLFELAKSYVAVRREEEALEVLQAIKQRMFEAGQGDEFAVQMDRLGEGFPASVGLLQFWAELYSDMSREAKYFDVLVRLFDGKIETGDVAGACETLERLVDIDPYDYRNLERLERLEGRADAERIQSLHARLAHAVGHGGQSSASPRELAESPSAPAPAPAAPANQTLEDLLVQAEIFLQYSLQAKAIERLQKIAQLFPGEEEKSTRLRGLYETAKWWPHGVKPSVPGEPEPPAAAPNRPSTTATGGFSGETLRDLSKIGQINRAIYRQAAPRAVLSVTVNEVGKHLRAARCLAVIGVPGSPPQMAAEYCSPGIQPAPGNVLMRLLAQMERAAPDALGGLPLDASAASVLREIGLETALGVSLTDKETQEPTGMLIAGHAENHVWKPNETYFMQAVGDQMLLTVNHTRLRSLVRTLAVEDERTGLLARSSYLDCLLGEVQRAKGQGTPLCVALLQLDHGPELAQSHGERALERHIEQMARALQPVVRQTDLAIKYAAWALAFVLPDTPLAGARTMTEKLRKLAGGVPPAWGGAAPTVSAGVVEALVLADYDNEDIVTDLVNRAEASLDAAERNGGNALESVAISKV